MQIYILIRKDAMGMQIVTIIFQMWGFFQQNMFL